MPWSPGHSPPAPGGSAWPPQARRNAALLARQRYSSAWSTSSPCSTASAACSASKTASRQRCRRVTALIQLYKALAAAGRGLRCIQRFFRNPANDPRSEPIMTSPTRQRNSCSQILARRAQPPGGKWRWIVAAGLLLVAWARLAVAEAGQRGRRARAMVRSRHARHPGVTVSATGNLQRPPGGRRSELSGTWSPCSWTTTARSDKAQELGAPDVLQAQRPDPKSRAALLAARPAVKQAEATGRKRGQLGR